MKQLLSPRNNFARNISNLMHEHDMTDKEIAQILEISVEKWIEKKQFKEPVTLEELMFISACFDIPVDHLFFTWRTQVSNRKIQNAFENKNWYPTLKVELHQVLGNIATTKYEKNELKEMKSLIEQLLKISQKKDDM